MYYTSTVYFHSLIEAGSLVYLGRVWQQQSFSLAMRHHLETQLL